MNSATSIFLCSNINMFCSLIIFTTFWVKFLHLPPIGGQLWANNFDRSKNKSEARLFTYFSHCEPAPCKTTWTHREEDIILRAAKSVLFLLLNKWHGPWFVIAREKRERGKLVIGFILTYYRINLSSCTQNFWMVELQNLSNNPAKNARQWEENCSSKLPRALPVFRIFMSMVTARRTD